jgi:4-alpha-glucanotransferase
MNTPGRESGNWRWRLEPGEPADATASILRVAAVANRR